MVDVGDEAAVLPPNVGCETMSRAIAVLAGGFVLAACTMSMPSLDFFKSAPATETLRIESEPPGADARTGQGQNCRTPCELVVPAGGEIAVSFALNGYQPLTIPVRTEQPGGVGSGFEARLQPNPVYAELQPLGPARPGKNAPSKKRTTASAPARQPVEPAASNPGGYPWPPPPQ
jgi:PEGA domain